MRDHRRIMPPAQSWERDKIGAGAPPVRLGYGWLLAYHAVSTMNASGPLLHGSRILDLEDPSRVLYRTPLPVLEPLTEYERSDGASAIVFPTAADLRAEGELDVYYGAADRVIAVARIALPAGPSSITKDS